MENLFYNLQTQLKWLNELNQWVYNIIYIPAMVVITLKTELGSLRLDSFSRCPLASLSFEVALTPSELFFYP